MPNARNGAGKSHSCQRPTPWRQAVIHRINAIPVNDTYRASSSASLPLSIMVKLVRKKIAAISPPSEPSQRPPPTPTIVIVRPRVASTDGRRTAPSLVPPDNLQLMAITQLSKGGLRKDGSDP